MESVITQFFNIPELVFLLANNLHRRGLSNLMLTNHHLYMLCIPEYYRYIYSNVKPGRKTIFDSTEATLALAKNSHFVRKLKLGLLDLVYYINCFFAFQDQLSRESGYPLSRPQWLAPPDPQPHLMLTIPLVTSLTSLHMTLSIPKTFRTCLYNLPSWHDPKKTLTKVCWILQLNPHLQNVKLKNAIFKNDRDVRLFAMSIFGLTRLHKLHLLAVYWKPSVRQLESAIFFSSPPSLQTLWMSVWSTTRGSYQNDFYNDFEYRTMDPGKMHLWEKQEEECGLTTTPRRLEPLQHLSHLEFRDLGTRIHESELQAMLQHCPSLRLLGIPDIEGLEDRSLVADAIAKSCPQVNTLISHSYKTSPNCGLLLFEIMDALPSQQIKKFDCNYSSLGGHRLETASLFRRHSAMLQTVVLESCRNVSSKVVRVLLAEFQALEVLDIRWHGRRHDLCINLEDAIEFSWACTRIRELTLTIGVPDEPLSRYHGEPFYGRPSPTTLSPEEKEQFRQLEILYQQIGTLVELKILNLAIFYYDPEGNRPLRKNTRNNTLPGMLTLGNETGQPGFLHHLGGLTKLRQLLGSVNARTSETKKTIGQPEVEWMNEHWPALERVQFYDPNRRARPEFRWLQEQRGKHNRLKIR